MSSPLALIVEDDFDLSKIFAQALQSSGFETQVVRSGDLAMTWLSSTAPNVVVLDLHLPHIAGTDILRHIHSDPALADTRVIVVTADVRLAETLRDEADLVLLKPISFSQLSDLADRLANSTSDLRLV
jgi:CheY-like chemotaxis protein